MKMSAALRRRFRSSDRCSTNVMRASSTDSRSGSRDRGSAWARIGGGGHQLSPSWSRGRRRRHARQRRGQRRRAPPFFERAAGPPRTASGSCWRSGHRGWRSAGVTRCGPAQPAGRQRRRRGRARERPDRGRDRRDRRRRRGRVAAAAAEARRRRAAPPAAAELAGGARVGGRSRGGVALPRRWRRRPPAALVRAPRPAAHAPPSSSSRRLSSSGGSVTASRNSSNGLRKVSSRTISFLTSAVVLRIWRMSLPSPDARSGSFFGPTKMRMSSRMTVISPIPRLNTTGNLTHTIAREAANPRTSAGGQAQAAKSSICRGGPSV